MKILGIETSCDETAAAVVENGSRILSNVVVSQIDIFAEYGGVIPEVAARSHLEAMMPVVNKALDDALCTWGEIDAIAVTHAPGLLGSLLIGTLTARTMAVLHDKPLYATHHLKSHVYANWIQRPKDIESELALRGASPSLTPSDDAFTILQSKIDNLFIYKGLGKEEVAEAIAGDIVAITGVSEANIGDTIATGDNPEALPGIELEAPTLSVYIGPNTSPLKGREGEFTTSRQIAERLEKELETNIALKLQPDGLGYKVSGRGELHLSVLIETMRREGYELEAGRPEVVYREIDGKKCEPMEDLTIEVAPEYVGAVSSELGIRHAELKSQEMTTTGTTRFVYEISTAALIGLRNDLLTETKGTVIMSSIPSGYRPIEGRYRPERNGALVAFEDGMSTAYALDATQARGILFIPPGVPVYQGMIIGLSNKKEDIDINICREKQLTNMRTHASDGAIQLTPYTQLSLEQCLDFLLDDELLEVTPKSLRLRKRQLDPIKRKRENRVN